MLPLLASLKDAKFSNSFFNPQNQIILNALIYNLKTIADNPLSVVPEWNYDKVKRRVSFLHAYLESSSMSHQKLMLLFVPSKRNY